MVLKGKEKDSKETGQSGWMEFLDCLKTFIVVALIFFVVFKFIAAPVRIVGHSMDPTLADGELGLTGIVQNFFKSAERQEIVVLTMKDENGKETHWVKRIIGLPGETIQGKDGKVYVNGELLDESAYLDTEFVKEYEAGALPNSYEHSFQSDFGPITLGEDQYFVMGDNRPNSKDSRDPSVGPVSREDILGTGIMVLYPFNEFGVKN